MSKSARYGNWHSRSHKKEKILVPKMDQVFTKFMLIVVEDAKKNGYEKALWLLDKAKTQLPLSDGEYEFLKSTIKTVGNKK